MLVDVICTCYDLIFAGLKREYFNDKMTSVNTLACMSCNIIKKLQSFPAKATLCWMYLNAMSSYCVTKTLSLGN